MSGSILSWIRGPEPHPTCFAHLLSCPTVGGGDEDPSPCREQRGDTNDGGDQNPGVARTEQTCSADIQEVTSPIPFCLKHPLTGLCLSPTLPFLAHI